jgi:hypothetical protein
MTGRQIFKRDELQLGIHLTGEIPPLSTSLLWSVNGIDNNIVPRSLSLAFSPGRAASSQSRCRALPNMISSQEGTEARLPRADLRL